MNTPFWGVKRCNAAQWSSMLQIVLAVKSWLKEKAIMVIDVCYSNASYIIWPTLYIYMFIYKGFRRSVSGSFQGLSWTNGPWLLSDWLKFQPQSLVRSPSKLKKNASSPGASVSSARNAKSNFSWTWTDMNGSLSPKNVCGMFWLNITTRITTNDKKYSG